MAESEEELKSLLMKVKEESKKAGLKLNIHRQIWVSLLGVTAPFSWVQVHKVLFVPSKCLLPSTV